MKKFLATILALVYLATTSGATLHVHYCMGKIYSVDFVKKDSCSKCGMEATDGCCKDEFQVLKVKDNHKLISNEVNLASSFTVLPSVYSISNIHFPAVATNLAANNNSPPLSSGTSLCILNCIFRV